MNGIKIMVNGAPGNVSTTIIKKALNDERFEIIPASLTGPEIEEKEYDAGQVVIKLIRPEVRESEILSIKEKYGDFISIDFTHPTAVNPNCEFYCHNKLPFVMGTTGGDREKLVKTVKASDICAVIAPNMAKQIVGFQAMMEYAANTFPYLFKGYGLSIKESHQQGKADTSGTAKAMVKYFNLLGCEFSEDDIEKVRDPEIQKHELGVPEEYLDGHGWHTYTLISRDKTVKFSFTHNVNGRDVYVDGTLDAVIYLSGKLKDDASKGVVFNMIDVLKNK